MIDVKIVIGDDVGGFTVREMALYGVGGTAIAICNTPDTEKVTISEGGPESLPCLCTAIQTALGKLDGRLKTLELKYGTNVTGNAFEVTFEKLSGLVVTGV